MFCDVVSLVEPASYLYMIEMLTIPRDWGNPAGQRALGLVDATSLTRPEAQHHRPLDCLKQLTVLT